MDSGVILNSSKQNDFKVILDWNAKPTHMTKDALGNAGNVCEVINE